MDRPFTAKQMEMARRINLILNVLVLELMWLLFQDIGFVDGQSCPQSIPTLTFVEACPRDNTEWIHAKDRKQCHLTIQNCSDAAKFQYHCLPNRQLDKLIEVCAPTKLIIGRYCPFYDMEKHTIEQNYNQPCNDHVMQCKEIYTSSAVHQYQECFTEISGEKSTKQENIISVQWSDGHLALAIGIYTICGCLIIVVALFSVRIAYLPPLCKKSKCCNNTMPSENTFEPGENDYLKTRNQEV